MHSVMETIAAAAAAASALAPINTSRTSDGGFLGPLLLLVAAHLNRCVACLFRLCPCRHA